MTSLNVSLSMEISLQSIGLINQDSEIDFSVCVAAGLPTLGKEVTHSRKGALALTGAVALGWSRSGLFLRVQTIS